MKIGILQREQCKALWRPCTAHNLATQLESTTCSFLTKRAATRHQKEAETAEAEGLKESHGMQLGDSAPTYQPY